VNAQRAGADSSMKQSRGGHADVLFALLFRVSFVVEEKSALASARQEKSTRQMYGVMLIG